MEKDQYQPLFEKLSIQPHALLLTPNQRLSKHLQQKFQKFRLENFKKDQNKPLSIIDAQIMSMANYLKFCFSDIQDQHPLAYGNYLLLEGCQEKLIWQKIIEQSQYGQSLLFKQQCAQEAAQAWQLIHDWQLNTSNFEQQHYYESIDILAFKNWEKQFKQQCKQQNWLSQAELLAFIIKAIEAREIQTPSHLYFYGFDELNISLKKFQQCLEKISVHIANIPLPKHQASYHSILACKDFNEEIHYAAIWAKQITSQNPSANVALVFPNLSQNRDIILRHCIEDLCPDRFISGENLYPLPFNISSGTSLAKIPLVAAALSLLTVNQIFTSTQTMTFDKLSRLLLSPFIPEAFWPSTERIRIESALRGLQQEEISLVQFKRILKVFNHNQAINHFFNESEIYIKKNPAKLSHTRWHEYFLTQLNAFQWLADFNLDSENYQALNKLKNCFIEFSQLDNIEPQCSLEKALERANFIISQQLFQPESKDEHNKQIHILGALEAAALDFTHIWVCQMDDETWPPRPKPNPFLPFSLQKTSALPHSSAQREYNFCKHLTERYMAHCNSIIFSYSNSEKGRVSSSSPLLAEIAHQTIFDISTQFQIDSDLFITNNLVNKINTSSQWEYFSDQELIPVETDEKIRGGQSILQNHANCPFRSFAQHRLNLEPLAEIDEGINSLERGALLHELMEKIWKVLVSSENLEKISQNDLKTLLATFAKHLNEQNIQKFPQKSIALKLEIERAQAIALKILEIDKQRPAFRIFSLEKPQAIDIAGLKTNIRIDRIDELEDGSLLFIDYKSGQQHQNKWLTPRMEEPQLPLYLISNDSGKKASGIAFAKLNHNDPGYTGIGNSDNIAPGIIHCARETKNNRFEPDWEKQINLWQEDLSMLAKDFLAGNFLVDPKNKSKTCEYCNFQKLCRIQEISN